MTTPRTALPLFCLSFLLAACGGVPPGGGYASVPTSTCTSGQQWTGGNAESPTMNPGQACIACHSTGEGPAFRIAGTVYGTLNAADNCGGESSGVQVEIKDADGGVLLLTANSAGNFFYESRTPLALPYTAKLIFSGGERAMGGAQTDGDCNACHTAAGLNGAPGRVAVP